MGLLDEAISESNVYKGPRCTVATVTEALDKGDLAEFNQACELLNEGRITAAALERVLRGRGFSVKGGTLRRHAKGECSCGTR